MNYPLRVGDHVWGEGCLNLLPTGTHLVTGGERVGFTKTGPDRWSHPHHGDTVLRNRNVTGDGYYKIDHLPDEVVGEQPPLTWGEYLWGFRDHVLAMSTRSGIVVAPVQRALDGLGIGERPIVPGQMIVNELDRNRIQFGTVVRMGQPEQWDHYGLFRRDRRAGWLPLTGGRALVTGRMVVESVPEPVDNWLEETVDQIDTAINQFKVRAWIVGTKAKAENSWCGTYEAVMGQLGITADILRTMDVDGFKIGDTINASVARRLPVGTIFTASPVPNSLEWYIRDGASSNRAGTRRLYGYGADEVGFRHNMTIGHLPLTVPDGGVEVLPMDMEFTEALFEFLPAGTQFRYLSGGGAYMLAQDRRLIPGTYRAGRAIPARGNHGLNDFGAVTQLRVSGLPL